MAFEIIALLSAFAFVALWYIARWIIIERQRRRADRSAAMNALLSTCGAMSAAR